MKRAIAVWTGVLLMLAVGWVGATVTNDYEPIRTERTIYETMETVRNVAVPVPHVAYVTVTPIPRPTWTPTPSVRPPMPTPTAHPDGRGRVDVSGYANEDV